MHVVKAADATELLERAGPLLADEARHNLILVLGGGTDVALEALALELGGAIPGAVGAVPEIEAFVAACARLHGVTPEPRVRQGIHALDAVIPPATPPGAPRAATRDDRELLVRWWGEFGVEALGVLEQDEEQNRRSVDHKLTMPGNGIALWEDGGEPVSAVGYGSPTPSGVRIGPVYTPPAQRGRGYASALTAHVSAQQLAGGRRRDSERDVPVLALGSRLALRLRDLERRDQDRPGQARLDHLVHVAALGGVVGVREALLVVGDQLRAARLRVVRLLELLAEDDVDGALGSHHRHLSSRPRDVEVGPDVLRAHDVVGAAVRLARDHGQLRHGRLGERVQELRAVTDDPAPLLLGPRKEARHVDEGDERDVERVAGADEACRLDRRVDVEHARERGGLVADDSDGVAAQPREAADDVGREPRLHLHELAVVDDLPDHLLHVVRLRRLVRDERVQLGRLAIDRIGGRRVQRPP